MKPKSKKLVTKPITTMTKLSPFYDFTALSEALNAYEDISIKNHNSSNVNAAEAKDANPAQSLSKDCYDFTSFSETLNNISKPNEKSAADDHIRVSKWFSVKIKKPSQIETLPEKQQSNVPRVTNRFKLEHWMRLEQNAPLE